MKSLKSIIKYQRLPAEYQEVEYIESTGTQYIDTGVVGKYGLSTYAKIIITGDSDANSVLLGSRTVDGATSPTRIYLGYRQFNGIINIGYQNELTSNTHPEQNVLHTYEYSLVDSYAKIKQDGVEIFSQAIEPNFSNGANLFIFANNYYGSSIGSYLSCKLYALKISDNDVLVRDYVPCYRKADNEIGLYDTVNDVFYTNAGTGTFLKGDDVKPYIESIEKIIKFSRLPNEYQEVEYIENSGTQYIDTGCYVNLNSKINIKCSINNTEEEFVYRIFGVRDSSNTNAFICGKNSATYNVLYAQFDSVSPTVVQNYQPASNKILNIELSSDGFKINGQVSREFPNPTSFTSSSTLPLFAHSSPVQVSISHSAIKIYNCKLYDNDTLIRDFIPCYRKADNVIGLYDLVNDQFYTNAGTGTFSKGSDIKGKTSICEIIKTSRLPNEYQEVEYLQSSGTQYIDTGIKLSSSDTVKCKFEITSKPFDYSFREGVFGTMEYRTGGNLFFVLLMRDPTLARVGTSSNQVTSTNLVLNTVYDTSLTNGTYIENGTTYTFTPHNGFTFTTNCYIFSRNQSSMLPTNAKVYSFKIVGKFNGVPCYRKSDNVAGMYDLVSNTFFTNAGTGSFSVGGDIN